MGRTARVAAAWLAATIGALSTAPPALAAPQSVTLATSRPTLDYGQSTDLSGMISPPAAGQTVAIVNEGTGERLGHTTTAADGSYLLAFTPDRNVRLHAAWGGKVSAPVDLGVRPVVSLTLRDVLLFGRARVTGQIEPALDGSVTITLFRGSKVASNLEVTAAAGAFSEGLAIERPGDYRAQAIIAQQEYLPGMAVTVTRRTPLPRLKEGSRGVHVRLLEERLRELSYHVPSPNRTFDHRTGDAVLAFRKVQGMSRIQTVTRPTWRALAAPKLPRPRAKRPRSHIEVDQTRQVLYVVREGEIARIVHVSTGGPGIGTTRDGVWRVWLRFAGYSALGLFMPSFFDGGRAIHGWPDVPPTPASHGCVRVPNWAAGWIYGQISVGSQVRIYHS